jgi:Zn finger protein HypA/HybF involved in hydrogenase expression
MQIDEKILFDCSVCHTSNHVPIDDLFDYHCKNCGAAAWQIEEKKLKSGIRSVDPHQLKHSQDDK